MHRIAILASGNGSNAQRIIEYFNHHPKVRVDAVLSNNPNAYVLERAKKLNVPTLLFNRNEFYESNTVLDFLSVQNVGFLVLAGFLWLIPDHLLKRYDRRILNIHPALLPKYGGKGMYGMSVHNAVIASGDQESGITIHFVNEKYDEGGIIFQAKCEVDRNDSPGMLAEKVHQLEYRYYPEIIEQVIMNNL